MRTNPLFLILFMLLLFISGACKEENDVEKMTLSANSFNVASNESGITLVINSQTNWEVSSDATWCVPNKQKGTGRATLSVDLTSNETSQERTATLTITDPTATLKVKITQKEADNQGKMTLSAYSFNVASNETDITLEINSQANWEASSNATWCVPDKLKGTGKTTLSINLTPNETSQERTATLTITDPTATLEVKITQSGEEHYKLPVIFHVLYNDAKDPFQNPDKALLVEIINLCNQKFANTFDDGDQGKSGVNINVEFVMATTNPSGTTLAEPGINRIKWSTPVMSCDKFMDTSNKDAISRLWDLNKYINIFLYTFEEENVLGISYTPYATSRHPLDGLYNGDRYFSGTKLSYPHCVSINNTYIDQMPEMGYSNPSEVVLTLTHELGHYIGLFHAFGVDDEKKGTSWREDTDYCDDTPNYDRQGYEDWLNTYYETTLPENVKFSELIKRTSITGKEFSSRNIMDYTWTWGNEFTPDQRERMRHVLNYSPLVPGPKYDQPSTRAIMDAPIPPARTIK